MQNSYNLNYVVKFQQRYWSDRMAPLLAKCLHLCTLHHSVSKIDPRTIFCFMDWPLFLNTLFHFSTFLFIFLYSLVFFLPLSSSAFFHYGSRRFPSLSSLACGLGRVCYVKKFNVDTIFGPRV